MILERGGQRLRAAAARAARGADPGALDEPAAADQPGGVFLRSTDQTPGGGPDPPHGRGARGARGGPRHPAPADGRGGGGSRSCRSSWPGSARRGIPRRPLPFMELPYFNGLGGFTPDGREYAIYLGPGTHTPAPWVNVIANPTFGTLVSETGCGLHVVRQQPAQPADRLVERSGDGSSVRGDVHPRRGDRVLLDDHRSRRSARSPPTGPGTGPGTRSSSTTATGSSRS